ncbi:hypothetical protein ACHAPX_008775 [Trichoderma viride]
MMRPYIYISGYPGSDKQAIAEEVARLVPKSKVYRSRLLKDSIAPLVDRDSPHYKDVQTSFRRHMLETIATSEATAPFTWIFTDSRSAESSGGTEARDYKDAADLRGTLFIPVILCHGYPPSFTEVISEFTEWNRQTGAGNSRLTRPAVLRRIGSEENMYVFGGPNKLRLDVSKLTAQEAAEKIYNHVFEVTDRY